MTKKIQKSSCLVREYDGFEGIDRTKSSGGMTDIVNFRLMTDKALRKREAAVQLTSLNGKPRAHYTRDDQNMLVLSGQEVILLNMSDLSQKRIGRVTSSGDAQFFCYDSKTILIDGNELYVYRDESLSPLDGYAPLYGSDWHPTEKGRINQQMNLLSRHYRISYKISSDDPSLFLLDTMTDSVDAAYINGTKVSQNRFSVNDGGFSLSCSLPISAGSELTLYMTAHSYPYNHDALKGCTRATTYGEGNGRGADASSVAFYGGSDPTRVFCTRRIEKEDFAEAKKEYSSALSIYVTSSEIITVGDGSSPVTATCKRGGKLLLFTRDCTYVMNETDESSSLMTLSLAGGCSAPNGATPMGDSPVTVSDAGILQWTPVKYDSNE